MNTYDLRGFEPAIPAIKRLHTYALDRKPIEIGYGYVTDEYCDVFLLARLRKDAGCEGFEYQQLFLYQVTTEAP